MASDEDIGQGVDTLYTLYNDVEPVYPVQPVEPVYPVERTEYDQGYSSLFRAVQEADSGKVPLGKGWRAIQAIQAKPVNQDALAVELLAEYRQLQVQYPELAEAAANDAEWLEWLARTSL